MPYATGGTVTTDGLYRIHTFTSSGTITFTRGGVVQALVVAGGGGGGGSGGQVGKAGGSGVVIVRYKPTITSSAVII